MVIILLIPLSPVGHVLVFGAIQRFFPDFFPSCFTEQRQNLLQLYESAEYSEFSIKENWRVRMHNPLGMRRNRDNAIVLLRDPSFHLDDRSRKSWRVSQKHSSTF